MLREKRFSIFAVLCMCLFFQGCTGDIHHHGYQLDEKKLSYIQSGKTTKRQVLKVLGSPTTQTPISMNSWYYIGKTTSQIAFLEQENIEDVIVKITFDDRNIVTNIDKKTYPENYIHQTVGEQTPTSGNDISLLEQLIGNIGRFEN